MLESFSNKSGEVGHHTSDGGKTHFDPDRRLDAQEKPAPFKEQRIDPDRRLDAQERPKEVFTPDGRIDPDKRIENSENEIHKGNGAKNKEAGIRREETVLQDIKKRYPEGENYQIVREAYLRDRKGEIVKDKFTDTARKEDFVVVKDGKAVDIVEVTSKTATKIDQLSKDLRIRQDGGNYIKDNNKNIVRIPDNLEPRVVRLD